MEPEDAAPEDAIVEHSIKEDVAVDLWVSLEGRPALMEEVEIPGRLTLIPS